MSHLARMQTLTFFLLIGNCFPIKSNFFSISGLWMEWYIMGCLWAQVNLVAVSFWILCWRVWREFLEMYWSLTIVTGEGYITLKSVIIQFSHTVRISIFWLADLYHMILSCDETTSLTSLSWTLSKIFCAFPKWLFPLNCALGGVIAVV